MLPGLLHLLISASELGLLTGNVLWCLVFVHGAYLYALRHTFKLLLLKNRDIATGCVLYLWFHWVCSKRANSTRLIIFSLHLFIHNSNPLLLRTPNLHILIRIISTLIYSAFMTDLGLIKMRQGVSCNSFSRGLQSGDDSDFVIFASIRSNVIFLLAVFRSLKHLADPLIIRERAFVRLIFVS